MDCSTLDLSVLHYLPEFAQIHVRWVSDAIQPSYPLFHLLLLTSVFPSSRVFPTSGGQSIRALAPVTIQYWLVAAAAAKLLQSFPTLCDPIDSSPLGSSVPGILQARILGWVAISFSSAWKWKVKVKSLSHSRLLATPWTAAYQAPLSMGFSRQEYWSGLPLPSPLTGWSPCNPRDSQESSPAAQFECINSSVLILLYGPALTSIQDYWRNHSFD